MSDRPDRFEGNFLESADMMRTGPVTLTIAGVVPPKTEKSADGRVIDKPILSFEGTEKRMVIGKTSQRCIKAQYGPKVADWVGKRIVVAVRYLKSAFGEHNVPCLRVIPPNEVPVPFAARRHMGQPEPFID